MVEIGPLVWNTSTVVTAHFANHGSEGVTVARVHSSCGCALLDPRAYEGRVVNPGETLALEVVFQADPRPGSQQAVINLATTGRQTYGVLVRAQVVATWDLSANRVDFGPICLDEDCPPVNPAVQRITFRSATQKVDRLQTQLPTPWLIANFVTKPDADEQGYIELSLAKDRLTPGLNTATLSVYTDDPHVGSLPIVVSAMGVAALTAYPAHLALLPGGTGQIRFMQRSNGNPATLQEISAHPELRCVALPNGIVEVSHESKTDSRQLTVRMTVVDETGKRGFALVSIQPLDRKEDKK